MRRLATLSVILLSILLIISCSAEEQNKFLTKDDSIKIVQLSLESKVFLRENLPYSDTLYVIKNRNYHASYPSESKYFTLIYIEDLPANKEVNHPVKNPDRRTRYQISRWQTVGDTVKMSLYNLGVREEYHFQFKFQDNTWNLFTKKMRCINVLT